MAGTVVVFGKVKPPQPFSSLRWVLRLAISFQVKDDGCVHHDAGISVLAVELGKGTTNINIDPILCLVSCPHYDAYPNEHHLTSYPQKSRNGIYRNLPLCWQSFTVLPV
jgi:hypothetical protein